MKKRKDMKKGLIKNFIYIDADMCPYRVKQIYKSGEIKRILREKRELSLQRK